jgi:bla regulator protein blaR1
MNIAKYLSDLWTSVAPAVGNHLWQSTLFAIAAGLLTLMLRKNQARTRYWIWMAASLKFLVPFSLLIAAGSYLGWTQSPMRANSEIYFAMEQIGQPFAQPVPDAISQIVPVVTSSRLTQFLPALLVVVWDIGFLVVVCVWIARWRRMSVAMRGAVPLQEGREAEALRRMERNAGLRMKIEMFLSRASLEPGIFGIARPILVWPAGISARLDDAHVEAILAHEVGHVRRRDNLFAAIHMLVEAIFWFHPLVWFLGARMVDEREVACDEEVLELGSERQVYAESILRICEFCVGSPLACVSGVTGADLKKRIVRIMSDGAARKLNFTKKLMLSGAALAAIALPVAFGVAHAAPGRARWESQNPATVPEFKYEVASIKLNKSGSNSHSSHDSDDEFRATNVSLMRLIRQAFLMQYGPWTEDGRVAGGPNWLDSEGYDLDAKMDSSTADALKKLSPIDRNAARQRMLQAVLADRFKLVVHTESKELPIYSLMIAKNGPKLHEAEPGNTYDKAYKLQNGAPAGPGLHSDAAGEMTGQGVAIADITRWLSRQLGRKVLDNTGLAGKYDFTLKWNPDDDESSGDGGLSIYAAVQQQLGLKLDSGKGPVEIVVIDHAERPSGN